jgi:hypothetical protein
MNENVKKNYLRGEREIEQSSREWLRNDSGLLTAQSSKALERAKNQMNGKYYRMVLITKSPLTYKYVLCTKRAKNAVLLSI